MASITKAVAEIKKRHMRFIEANYHLHNSRLIKERRKMMEEGAVVSEPWIGATPLYKLGKQLKELNLPFPVKEILEKFYLAGVSGVYDRPYLHQAKALEAFFSEGKNLIVSTGTGSGKTEIFLYSILGQLALESERSETTHIRGFRSIILYPMNALVADQVSRLRQLLGHDIGAEELEKKFGRHVQFGMYTSRTPYHGRYDTDKNERQVKPIIDYYLDLKQNDIELFNELKRKGRIPAKNLEGFRNYRKEKDSQFRTQPKDTELFTRQEMHSPNKYGGTPDILITNYSMLEYMLLRPIEQTFFEQTREWLLKDEKNQLTLVLDEAHLYRGAQGAEVALLLSRLLQHLKVSSTKIRFILTSASLGNDEEVKEIAPEFAGDLTSSSPESFEVITSEKKYFGEGKIGTKVEAEVFANFGYNLDLESVKKLATQFNWRQPDESCDEENLWKYLGSYLDKIPVFQMLQKELSNHPQSIHNLGHFLFPDLDNELAKEATANLIFLGTNAKNNDQSLLPAKLHMFLRGLPKLYACVNPECNYRQIKDPNNKLLGKIYTAPQFICNCGSRVFELLSHRTCGAAYIKAFRNKKDIIYPMFLWTEKGEAKDLEEVHILLEKPRSDPDPKNQGIPLSERTMSRYLDIFTGHLCEVTIEDEPERFIKVWVPFAEEQKPSDPEYPWSWTRCPVCGIQERRSNGQTKIMDLETKGEEIFANLVKQMFYYQSPVSERKHLPNRGKKVLCFSDGRQKAARLARDLQQIVEKDSFREVIVDVISSLPEGTSLNHLFPALVVYTHKNNIAFFDDSDGSTSSDDGYKGSRTRFVDLQHNLEARVKSHQLGSIEDISLDDYISPELNRSRPKQYNSALLRLLGDENYSIWATLVGYLKPTDKVMTQICDDNPSIDPKLLEEIVLETLRFACIQRAYDPMITDLERRESRGHPKKKGEGIFRDEIIPKYLTDKVKLLITDEQIGILLRSLYRPSKKGEQLFVPLKDEQYVINDSTVTLQIALEKPLFRCKGCKQFSFAPLAGKCPRKNCDGILETVSENDVHMSARKSLLRDPCKAILKKENKPFTLRSEEHSAQLSAKDHSEVFSKAEKYELLFQDVLINQDGVEQPIDVLSCTTTMEVGIDIGSLTAVALRTVPPRPENYDQRSGRAGRRGAALSIILTFADNSPHEVFYFKHPNLMVGGVPSEPIIYTGNRKIAERHINASLLERFFNPEDIDTSAAVFESLGSSKDFFIGEGRHSLKSFELWLQQEILTEFTDTIKELGELLPEKLSKSFIDKENWRTKFIKETSVQFLFELNRLKDGSNWSLEGEGDLLVTLLNDALLPTFSFPIDVCDFVVQGIDKKKGIPKTFYEISSDIKQALSIYVPGRQIVVDKKTFTSYGLYFNFASDLINRATGIDWDNLPWLNYCPNCETILEENIENLSEEQEKCPVCNSEIMSQHLLRPLAFAPEIKYEGDAAKAEEFEERIYATPAKFPIPTSRFDQIDAGPQKFLKNCSLHKLASQKLLVANFGPDQEGYHICTSCGAVDKGNKIFNSHNRPYPRDNRVIWSKKKFPAKCSGNFTCITFGYELKTDLAVLRIPIKKPLKWDPMALWFNTAIKSLTEALVLGASRVLGIDSNELAGGYRILPRFAKDNQEINGYVELFLYDTTPGGAGFSSKTFERFDKVQKIVKSLLSECDCESSCHSCLRTYNNRIWHNDLNRFLGLELLNYATEEVLPSVEKVRADILTGLLYRTIKLMSMNPDIKLEMKDEKINLWQIKFSSKVVKFNLLSCMVDSKALGINDSEESISDYDISYELPKVAYQLLEKLRI